MGKNKTRKLYRIGEVAKALDLKTFVLRFWESEFPQLRPVRTPKGQRLYCEDHVALLRHIRSLLHEQGMTIEGARRVLSGQQPSPQTSPLPLPPTESPAESPAPSPSEPPVDPFAQPLGPQPHQPDHTLLRSAVEELQHVRHILLSDTSAPQK